MELNPMCKRDDALWMTLSPLIYFHAVEYHLPHRVMRQFRKLQDCPPMEFSTYRNLHGINRRWRFQHTDWAHYHRAYMLEWADRSNRSRDVSQIHQRPHFVSYLRWLHDVARLQLRPAMTQADIGEGDSSEEDIVDEYDEFTQTSTRPEKAPINAFYGRQLARISNKVSEVLMLSKGSFQRMRHFVEVSHSVK